MCLSFLLFLAFEIHFVCIRGTAQQLPEDIAPSWLTSNYIPISTALLKKPRLFEESEDRLKLAGQSPKRHFCNSSRRWQATARTNPSRGISDFLCTWHWPGLYIKQWEINQIWTSARIRNGYNKTGNLLNGKGMEKRPLSSTPMTSLCPDMRSRLRSRPNAYVTATAKKNKTLRSDTLH